MGQMQRGSAIARLAGMNTKKHPDVFDDSRVAVWVYEEEVSQVSQSFGEFELTLVRTV